MKPYNGQERWITSCNSVQELAQKGCQPIFNEQPMQQPIVAPPISEDSHLELLHKVNAQLDDLSINLVQGPRVQPSHQDARAFEAQP